MAKTVIELQNAFRSVINTLNKNERVLAIFVFGSIVSGDVWEESDIDLFVVYQNGFNELRDVYSETLGVPVHARLLNKNTFLELYESDGKRGIVRNLLSTSKLVFSKDEDITNAYNKARYCMDVHWEKWNLFYLGKLLKDLGICKKYLQNGGINTSYEVLIRTLDSFSKLYISINGYAVTKDSLTMAMNLNNKFQFTIDNLFSKKVDKNQIKLTIDYIDEFLNKNISIASKQLLDYLYDKNKFISSYEIKNDDIFKDFSIKLENILKELSKRNIVLRKKRTIFDSEGKEILDENVYAVKITNS